MSRGRIPFVREPAAGVALAQCVLARMFPAGIDDVPLNSYHQTECRFCVLTDAEATTILKDFDDWAGTMTGIYPPEVEAFLMLPAEEQARLVEKQRRVEDPW